MREIINDIKKSYRDVNVVSRLAVKYVNMFAFALFAAALVIYIYFYGDYSNWDMIKLSCDLADCAAGCSLSAFAAAFLSEIIYRYNTK